MHGHIAWLLAAIALVWSGCGAADDLVTVELGRGDIAPVTFDQTYDLSGASVPDCPEGAATVPTASGGEATILLADTPAGCSLTVQQMNRVLFDEAQVRETSEQLEGRDIGAVDGASVIIEELRIEDGSGRPIDVTADLESLQLRVDGEVLATEETLTRLESGPVDKELPEPLLQEMKSSIENGEPVTADIAVELDVKDAALGSFPQRVRVRAVLQPVVEVDLLEAAI